MDIPDRHFTGPEIPRAVPVCDFHVHLGYSSSQAASSPDETMAVLRTAGFSAAVVFPFERSEGLDYSAANDLVLEAAARWPELVPFARVDTRDLPASLDELRRAQALGARGLKIHPLNDAIDPAAPATGRLLAEAHDLGLPVILHTNRGKNSEPFDWEPRAREFPDLPVILGHAGFFLWRDAMEVAWRQPNVWLEVSLAEAIICAQVAEFADLDRVLFGSDHPYGDPSGSWLRVETALRRVGVSAETVRAVWFDNAQRLLGRPISEAPIEFDGPTGRRQVPAVLRCRDREIPATAYDLFDADCAVLCDDPAVDPADADVLRVRLGGAWYSTRARVLFGHRGRYALRFIEPPPDLKRAIAQTRP